MERSGIFSKNHLLCGWWANAYLTKCINNDTFIKMEINKKITAEFFKTEQSNEPVRDFLKSLESEDKKSVGADIMAVEMSWPIGYPRVRKLDTDLWEVRTNISDNRICRVLFTISGKKMILLHGFIKKSQKTPKDDLDLGKKRKGLVLGGKK